MRMLRVLALFLRPSLWFIALALAVMFLSRLFLAWTYADRLAATSSLAAVVVRGLSFDLIVVCAVCAVVTLVQWLAPSRLLGSAAWRNAVRVWFSTWLALIVFNEFATPDFAAEFGARPNRLFFEYLFTPGEILLTIWADHRAALLVGVAATLAAGLLGFRLTRSERSHVPPWPVRLLVLAPVLVGLFVGLRGSTGHRPIGASYAATSTDALVNELPLNSTYSVAHALVQMRREETVMRAYSRMPEAEMIARVRAEMQLPPDAFYDTGRPTEHELVPTGKAARKPNLVILLEESLGAHFVASLGGAPIATRIDSWRPRSFWFDQLYATGTRSARGMEAVSSGFPPTRSRSVIKLEGAQHEFFTLPTALRSEGYYTEFIYGGDSDFDNVRRFLLGNGVERVIDFADLAPTARFKTTWGVSDEDLYARVHQEVREHARHDQPFFMLVFSTSNHPPHDFPDGRIELYEQPKSAPNNAARYADFALGSYLETAAQSEYWDNTVFMVVADHESKTIGEGLVPVNSFHIPAFIAGGPVRPRIVSRIASQIDLLPTVLSLMGLKLSLPAVGIDQSRTDLSGPGRAVMQFNDNAAYRLGDDVVILVAGIPPQQFRVKGPTLLPETAAPELVRDALAFTQWPVMAYRAGWYH